MTDIAGGIEALHKSGEILHFILSRIPRDALSAGWIEEGLLQSTISDDLQAKHNQEQVIIPTDRFVRLIHDREMNPSKVTAMLLIGEKGTHMPRLCVVVGNGISKRAKVPCVLSFWSRDSIPSENVDLVSDLLMRAPVPVGQDEPVLDYIEQLKADFLEGKVVGFSALKIPKKKFKVSEWVGSCTKGSDFCVASEGDQHQVVALARVFGRWMVGLQIMKAMRQGTAALIFSLPDRTELCLWDSEQRLATVALFKASEVAMISRSYLNPLWTSLTDLPDHSSSPKVEVRQGDVRGKKRVKDKSGNLAAFEKSVRSLEARLSRVPIAELEERVRNLEEKDRPTVGDGPTSTLLLKRLDETAELLEALSQRLRKLEEKLQDIGATSE